MINTKNNFNILLVDENINFCNNLKAGFNDNYNIQLLHQFNDFEEYLIQNGTNFELILLDIKLFSQYDNNLLKFINTHSKAKVVVLSDTDDQEDRDHYFKYGILDFHNKTNNIDYIISDIEELITELNENHKENILVIDDSTVVNYAIKYLLKNKNYTVSTALNAKIGIDIIENTKLSLLILDMELPDMHGIEVLDILRDKNLINEFPILVISGSNNPATVRKALKKGASDFLKKPFIYEEFLLKVDLCIKSSQLQQKFKIQQKEIENNLLSFQALVNSTIEALFIFDKNICIDTNNVAVELFGYSSKSELIGQEIFSIFSDISQEHREQLLDDTIDHNFEDTLIHQNKSLLDVQIKEHNVHLEGKNLKIIAIIDITQIKQKEQMINNQSKMASMGEMIGNIAHQWRQPLTAISVAAGGIKLGYELDISDQDETVRELDNIVDNTQFLSTTIEDFQNFLKNDRTTINFNVKETIEKSIAIISANLDSHEITIINKYEKHIQLNGIQNDLIQVLLNIINNAADILKELKGVDQQRYILIETFTENDYAYIKIQDSAGGVPSHIINKIFEPYFTTKHQSKGTGLGLYMTHKIVVDNMLGTIDVKNESFTYNDKELFGATFLIKLPLS